ncbi:MAG: thioesterase family protein [Nanoarchaeota archaeon]
MDLSKKLYSSSFEEEVFHLNDDNKHLNNKDYFWYLEKVRERFLAEFGWSDKYFRNEKNIAQTRRGYIGDIRYRGSFKKGDIMQIGLEITKGKMGFFHMTFNFYDVGGKLIFNATSSDRFVKVEGDKELPIPVPDFFLEALRKRKG